MAVAPKYLDYLADLFAGMGRYRPFRDQPDLVMSYWQVPAEVLEDADALLAWTRTALQVALTARAAKPAKAARRRRAMKTPRPPGPDRQPRRR